MPTILIVDDEEGFLQIMEMILQRAGYRVLLARDGNEGLKMAQTHKPDAIILDDMMPGMSGGDVCKKIKENCETQPIPVIMCSAGAKILSQTYVERIGANAILIKPCLPEEVKTVIHECLSARVK
jgi:CheY-like chemotaxis protein